MILAYADDIYVIAETIAQGQLISKILLKHLRLYGLDLNDQKSDVLVKGTASGLPTTVPIDTLQIPIVKSLKVLGTTLTSNMHRKSAIQPRMNSAIRCFKSLLPHLSEMRASIDLLIRFYQTIFIPTLTYGLNCISITQRNMKTLMNRELLMVRDLASIADPKTPQVFFKQLLNNRTINRRVSVSRIRYFAHVIRSSPSSLILKIC